MGTGLRPGLLTFDTLNIGVPVFFIQQVRIIIGLAHLLSSPVPAGLSRAEQGGGGWPGFVWRPFGEHNPPGGETIVCLMENQILVSAVKSPHP